MTMGKDWVAELEIVLNSLIQAYRTEAFNASSGCSKAEHMFSRTGTAGLEVRDGSGKENSRNWIIPNVHARKIN